MIPVLSDGTCRARKPHRCDLACEWSRARVEAACDRQEWSPSHPSRERARALWQRVRGDEPPARMERTWWGDVPGTALERRLT